MIPLLNLSPLQFETFHSKRFKFQRAGRRSSYVGNNVQYQTDENARYFVMDYGWAIFGFLLSFTFILLLVDIFFYTTSPVMPTSTLCTSSFVSNDKSAETFRSLLNAPNGFTSCAVIGSAGFMRLQRLGKEIDAHQFVIRANLAPVGGFEEIVGKKTSMRVINSEAIGAILKEKLCSDRKEIRGSICADYPVYLNTGDLWFVNKYKNLCPNTTVFDNSDLNSWDPALHAQWQGLGTNLMSGAYALAIALKLCPNGTAVYGVSHSETFQLNNNESATYHYYDERRQSVYDSLPSSAIALTKLAKTQAGCMTLHKPTTLFPKYELRNVSSIVTDKLVDDVRHNLARETYLSHNLKC